MSQTHLLTVACPRCGRRSRYTGNPHRPFCSEACRLIDLAHWADADYRIAGDPQPQPATPSEETDG